MIISIAIAIAIGLFQQVYIIDRSDRLPPQFTSMYVIPTPVVYHCYIFAV